MVEDNAAVAEVIRRLLPPIGYHVTVAPSPATALTLLDSDTVDLVITDVVLPELTGSELAARIHEQRPDMPIIHTSGYTPGILSERADLAPDAIEVDVARGEGYVVGLLCCADDRACRVEHI